MAALLPLKTACLSLAVLFAGGAWNAVAQPAAQHRVPRHEYKHEVEEAEDQWRAAMTGGSAEGLGKLLADDYTGITSSGAIQSRDEEMSNLRSGRFKVKSLTISDRKVRIYRQTAVVTSQAELAGVRDGEPISGRFRYTRVYVRNGQGQWKIVSFEASRIQEK